MTNPAPQSISTLRTTVSLIELIGNTPLVQLHRVAPEGTEVWVKCEQYNPGGSVKDRVALAMIEAAEKANRIEPGRSVIVEPTSGNTSVWPWFAPRRAIAWCSRCPNRCPWSGERCSPRTAQRSSSPRKIA
jgi:hypothetical protein